MTAQEELAERCAAIADMATEALDWIEAPENAETIGPNRKSLTQLLRRSTRRARKLGRAARTKMSVSVFGPSQAGKSFLVSVLARPRDGRLVADFNGPGGALDYIGEINPEGEGESTGLVTRFTMTKDATPDGFPIRVSLLSEADIARTIVNSFYMDGDQSEPPPEPEDLSRHIEAFRAKAGAPTPGRSFEEVLEIAEYVNGVFGKTAYAAALRTFWEDAATLAPALPPAERAAFLAILWGGHAPLTDLYLRLAQALGRIGHPEEVFAPLDALVPRETSIIDVKTLHGLYQSGEQGTLALRTPSGATIALPRALVCALAAELVLPMKTLPSEIFAETDLLDFPGARNRFEQPLSKTLADPAASATQLLLRGKVAYLFDRYVENQEITSMLLCVPDSNMETVDLPGLVENWIGMTHGNRPERRAETPCVLFFVMTKFDKHLGDSAAAGGEGTRFERRVQASLLEKFGRSKDGWVETWTPGQPFRNCFWLRNPNFFVEGLIDYDDARREVSVRPGKEARLAELRAGCLAAENVQRHFADPAAAWDAAMAMNDGGVGYIIAELGKVCSPASKTRQIGAQIDKVAGDLAAALGPYHVSGDIEKRIAERRIAADAVIDGLEQALRAHRFGAVLAALMVDRDGVQERIARVPSSIRISGAVAAAAGPLTRPGPAPLARPQRPGRGEASPVAVAEAPVPGARDVRTMTPEAFQAETAIDVWIEGLSRLREDPDTAANLCLTPAAAADLVGELIHGLRRRRVAAVLGEELRAISFGHTIDKQAEPAAIVCAERINDFVATLGMSGLPEAERPAVTRPDGSVRPVFARRAGADRAENLPAQPRAVAEETWTDWVYALDALFEANAKDSDKGDVNIEQNLRLGTILSGLGAR